MGPQVHSGFPGRTSGIDVGRLRRSVANKTPGRWPFQLSSRRTVGNRRRPGAGGAVALLLPTTTTTKEVEEYLRTYGENAPTWGNVGAMPTGKPTSNYGTRTAALVAKVFQALIDEGRP